MYLLSPVLSIYRADVTIYHFAVIGSILVLYLFIQLFLCVHNWGQDPHLQVVDLPENHPCDVYK